MCMGCDCELCTRAKSLRERAGVVCKLQQIFYLEMTEYLGMLFSKLVSSVPNDTTPTRLGMVHDLTQVCLSERMEAKA